MIMNRLHYFQGSKLKSVRACGASAITCIFLLLTVEATTPSFSLKDNQNCKRFAFICVHSQHKQIFVLL